MGNEEKWRNCWKNAKYLGGEMRKNKIISKIIGIFCFFGFIVYWGCFWKLLTFLMSSNSWGKIFGFLLLSIIMFSGGIPLTIFLLFLGFSYLRKRSNWV